MSSAKDVKQPDIKDYSDDRPVRRFGCLLVIVAFGFFGIWSFFAPLGSAAIAPGTLTVESYRKVVQHLEGGIVKAIHIHDGDHVKKGEVLIELEDTSSRAQLETLRGQLFSALAREARLIAERDNKSSVIFPVFLKNAAGDPRADEDMRVQNQAFLVRKHSRDGEIGILREQHQQLLAKIVGIKAQKSSSIILAESLTRDLTDFRAMLKEGYVEKQKVTELERRLTEVEGNIGDYTAEIATAQTQISEISLKALQIEKDFQREVVDELSKVQTELSELREKYQWLGDTVERTTVNAPESGMVMGLTVHNLGTVIPPGGHILDIVPQQEKLLVEAQVSPLDIDRVKIGQQTEIRFSAFKSSKTLKINGKLIKLSADRLLDEKNQTSYFLARVEVDNSGIEELRVNGLELLPGMPVEVLINTGDRTFFEYIMQPMSNIFARSFKED